MISPKHRPNDDITSINTGDKNLSNSSTCLKFLIVLEKTIFALTEENFQPSIKKVMKFFDSNFSNTFNTIISNIVYNAFSSRKQAFDIYLNFLKTLQMKEEEINQNIVKLLSIFIKRVSTKNTQESYYLIEKMIEQNLIDKNITKNINSKYFSHYKAKEENQNQNHLPFGYNRNDPIEKYFLDNYEELSKNDWELHKKYIKEGHNPNEIAKVIRNDEIEKLQEISSQTNFDFNQTIEPSLYERCSFINKENVTLIDYAAFFSSVKCFKYLLMNNVNVNNTGKYAVAGGNEEIIHLCEQNHSSFEGSYETAIKFHQNDIFKYVYENKSEKTQPNSMFRMLENKTNDLVSFCIKQDNYEILAFLEEKGINVNPVNINETARNGNLYLVECFLQNNQIPINILLFASESDNIELVKYVLDKEEIDVNAKYIHLNNLKYVLII